jgi:N utilization substance protein B
MGTYELMAHPDVPFRVVINEAVELAKMFGATNSHKYVNGILDKVASQLRPAEVTVKKKEVMNNNDKKGIGV